jgi:oligoendopeptidase F
MSKSIIEISKDCVEITRKIIDLDGEITPELEAWEKITSENLIDKVDSYSFVIQELELRNESFKQLKQQANDIQNKIKNSVKRLESNLKNAIKLIGNEQQALIGNMYEYKLKKPRRKIEVVAPDQLDLIYTKEVTSIVPDMEAIEKDIDAGLTIPGVEVTYDQSLLSKLNTKGKLK